MRQKVENGAKYLLVTPGNYGVAYIKAHMELPFEENMKCSNYVGETLIWLWIWEWKDPFHFSYREICKGGGRDYQIPIPAVQTAERRWLPMQSGRDFHEGAREILDTITTDEALAVIQREELLKPVMKELTERIAYLS